MYDVIVVGARCAGSPTAMLVARRGHKVLLVDRSTFPSDKLSTHYIHPPGVQHLEKWGLLEAVRATNCPTLRTFTLYSGDTSLMVNEIDEPGALCPRRYLLDKILVDAAVAAGAEMHEAFTVDEVIVEGGEATGIVGHGRGGERVREQARFVVGAEGHHSIVADAVHAPKYNEKPPLSCAYYSYFSGMDLTGAEVHIGEAGGVLVFPTNDGMVCIAAGTDVTRFEEYKKDIDGVFMGILDASPEFAAKVRAGKREERFMGTADVPNFFRKPWGPGWALVGDAGYMKDPITGFGITDAFRDADLLAAALDDALAGRKTWNQAGAWYQDQRDAAAMPMYEMTTKMAAGELDFASAGPPPVSTPAP
jgi:flavin-dependent dehydrogenase